MTKKNASCLSILGTASDVGKSIIVTALCRIFSNMGLSVSPYKAQNMSNNSYVTVDSLGNTGEIGRAQVSQAHAARIEPTVHMNPVLLKPESDVGAQVVVLGKAMFASNAVDYEVAAEKLKSVATESLQHLRSIYDVVVLEGAGSCAEMNLKSRDFVNFFPAHQGDAKVVLVADIDRGGVFAQVLGTLSLLSPEEKQRVVGVIINRFRGDPKLFGEGVAFLEERSGIPVLGVVPYIPQIGIASEDAVVLDTPNFDVSGKARKKVRIAVVHLPHISNFTDFSPLENHPHVSLQYIKVPFKDDLYDAVILPGTKNVRGDLKWLRNSGFASMITKHAASGKTIVGICGGYQMIGGVISDSHGIEGPPGTSMGLGLLSVDTELNTQKKLIRRVGESMVCNSPVWGYEIHQGRSTLGPSVRPLVRYPVDEDKSKGVNASLGASEFDGAMSSCGFFWGTYLHGIFDSVQFTDKFVSRLRPDIASVRLSISDTIDAPPMDAYDRLAQAVLQSVDIPRLMDLAGVGRKAT